MFVAVCYDVSSDRTRRKVVKALEDYGARVQKSVFECRINDRQFAELRQKLSGLIRREGDLVRYYNLCRRCQQNIEFRGGLPPAEEKEHTVI